MIFTATTEDLATITTINYHNKIYFSKFGKVLLEITCLNLLRTKEYFINGLLNSLMLQFYDKCRFNALFLYTKACVYS